MVHGALSSFGLNKQCDNMSTDLKISIVTYKANILMDVKESNVKWPHVKAD